ncbi:MAG: DUF533 domain-containing protein [Xanthomonadales bacterium]|nr:DUF533 domain-containing protein [Xanthomonadales bacterium]
MNVERLLGDLLMGGMGGRRRNRGTSSMLGGLGIGKAQVGVGLLGVAFAAWEHYQGQQKASAPAAGGMPPPQPLAAHPQAMPPPPPPPRGASTPAPPSQSDLLLVLEVMIAAAHADGQIDAQERATILEKAMQLELSSAERQQLMAALDQPPDAATLAARARPELASDLYGAAVLAISIDTPAERAWLDQWGNRLGLNEQDRRLLEAQLAPLLG